MVTLFDYKEFSTKYLLTHTLFKAYENKLSSATKKLILNDKETLTSRDEAIYGIMRTIKMYILQIVMLMSTILQS